MGLTKTIPLPFLIGSLLGFVLFFGMGYDPGIGEPFVIGGIVAGILGSVVGALIAWPIYLLRRKDAKQDTIEKQSGIPIKEPESVTGLWRCNKNCLLYTSPSPRDKRQSRMPSSA